MIHRTGKAIASDAEWLELPELVVPEVRPGQRWQRVDVQKVGCLAVPVTEDSRGRLGKLAAVEEGKFILPFAVLRDRGGDRAVRLPADLSGWAIDRVGLAAVHSVRFLPGEVEFRFADGHWSAGTKHGAEYQIRGWLKE